MVAFFGRTEEESFEPFGRAKIDLLGNQFTKQFVLRMKAIQSHQRLTGEIQNLRIFQGFKVNVAWILGQKTAVIADKIIFKKEKSRLFFAIEQMILAE